MVVTREAFKRVEINTLHYEKSTALRQGGKPRDKALPPSALIESGPTKPKKAAPIDCSVQGSRNPGGRGHESAQFTTAVVEQAPNLAEEEPNVHVETGPGHTTKPTSGNDAANEERTEYVSSSRTEGSDVCSHSSGVSVRAIARQLFRSPFSHDLSQVHEEPEVGMETSLPLVTRRDESAQLETAVVAQALNPAEEEPKVGMETSLPLVDALLVLDGTKLRKARNGELLRVNDHKLVKLQLLARDAAILCPCEDDECNAFISLGSHAPHSLNASTACVHCGCGPFHGEAVLRNHVATKKCTKARLGNRIKN